MGLIRRADIIAFQETHGNSEDVLRIAEMEGTHACSCSFLVNRSGGGIAIHVRKNYYGLTAAEGGNH